MTNDEINRRVSEIMEAMPSDKPNGAFVAHMGGMMYSPGRAWKFDIDAEAPAWQPLDFCTDIAAAWRCVEWAETKQRDGVMKFRLSQDRTGVWEAQFGEVWSSSGFARITDRSAPLAICLAFITLAICLAFITAFGGEQ